MYDDVRKIFKWEPNQSSSEAAKLIIAEMVVSIIEMEEKKADIDLRKTRKAVCRKMNCFCHISDVNDYG